MVRALQIARFGGPEALRLVSSGKVRYVGCSNFAGWQVMKALGVAARDGRPRFVSNQVYLSLLERSAEYDIVPTALDQGLRAGAVLVGEDLDVVGSH